MLHQTGYWCDNSRGRAAPWRATRSSNDRAHLQALWEEVEDSRCHVPPALPSLPSTTVCRAASRCHQGVVREDCEDTLMDEQIEIVESQAFAVDGLAIMDKTGAVWRTHSRPWWDVASWLWWFLSPGDKKWVQVRQATGKVRIRAVCVAKTTVQMGKPSSNPPPSKPR